jgi:O-methyltransferase
LTPPASYSPWLADPEFRKTWHVIRDNSLVDVYRCYELWNLTGQVASLHGDFLEVGVWRGGTGCLLAERIRRLGLAAQIFLCDTFGGVVKAGIKDTDYVGGEHADTSRETVNRLASSLGLDNVVVLQGIFPDETGEAVADRALRFVHIDVDVYDSAKGVTDFVWPRLVSGGILVYDDYGFLECPGVTRYVNETHRGADRILIQNLNGHAIVVKR